MKGLKHNRIVLFSLVTSQVLKVPAHNCYHTGTTHTLEDTKCCFTSEHLPVKMQHCKFCDRIWGAKFRNCKKKMPNKMLNVKYKSKFCKSKCDMTRNWTYASQRIQNTKKTFTSQEVNWKLRRLIMTHEGNTQWQYVVKTGNETKQNTHAEVNKTNTWKHRSDHCSTVFF